AYDPNLLSSPDVATAQAAKRSLDADPANPLLERSYRETFFPGSTFKVVTASTGLELGVVSPDAPVYPTSTGYVAPLTNRPLRNFGGSSCGGTLFEVLRVSCNSAFAEMGAEDIGPDGMITGAESF